MNTYEEAIKNIILSPDFNDHQKWSFVKNELAKGVALWEAKIIVDQASVSGNEANQPETKKDGEVAVCNCHTKGGFIFNEVTQELYCSCGKRIKVAN